MTQYTLTKIKTFNGREGQGINATILKDGKPIAFVMDDASGGEMDIDFTNPGQTAKSYAQHSANARKEEEEAEVFARNWWLTSPEAEDSRKMFHDLEAQYPSDGGAKNLPHDSDCLHDWINAMVDLYETKKRLDRIAKKKCLFRIKGEKYGEGEYRTMKAPYSPQVQAYFDKKYPGQIEMIYGVTA